MKTVITLFSFYGEHLLIKKVVLLIKGAKIDKRKHCVIKATHPSPLGIEII
jgi:uracil DNA glycosylase